MYNFICAAHLTAFSIPQWLRWDVANSTLLLRYEMNLDKIGIREIKSHQDRNQVKRQQDYNAVNLNSLHVQNF